MRKYRPEIGRWMSRDPIGEVGHILLHENSTNPEFGTDCSKNGCCLFCINNPINLFDKDGRVVPAIVIGGAALSSTEIAAIAAGLSAALCLGNDGCREAIENLVEYIVNAIKDGVDTLCRVRCRIGNHPPHHSFVRPHFGIPPWKTCWQRHIQVNCWLDGIKASDFFGMRIPYGPCYKYKNGVPPVTH